MNRSVVCESWWKNLIQQLSLNMFLDFNGNCFYLNPGWIFVLLYIFLSLLNGCLGWWSTDLTLNLRRRFTALMLKCKNPTSELVLAILLVHTCWSWIRGWKLDTLAGIGISKKQHSQAAVDWNRQSATVTKHSKFFHFFPWSYSSATVQKRAWCSSQPTSLKSDFAIIAKGFSLQTGFGTIGTFCTSSTISPACRPACLTLSPCCWLLCGRKGMNGPSQVEVM